MKNKLWVFGDSFTKGGGLTPDKEYYQQTFNGQKIWSQIVADHFNLELVNHGYSWCGATLIFKNLFHYIPEISKNDKVVFTNGQPRWILLPPKHLNSNLLRTAYTPYHPRECPEEIIPPFINLEEQQIGFDYANKIIDKHYHTYWSFWEDYGKTISNVLDMLKIKNYFWPGTLIEGKFETIRDVTDGKIPDIHWSWKGNTQMAEYIIKNIEND